MNLLAIETSTDACSVALAVGEEVRVDHRVAPREHARLVLPMIDALLAEAGVPRSALDGVAFGRGPGSFTGVRVAAAVTQGIALGLDIGVVGVSTLATIAQGCFRELGDTHVGVALDARLDEIYWGAFRVETLGDGADRAAGREESGGATGGDGAEAVAGRDVVRACTSERVCPAALATLVDDVDRSDREDGEDGQRRDVVGTGSGSARPDGHRRTSAAATAPWRLAGPGAERYGDALRTTLHLPPDAAIRAGRWPHARDTLALARVAIAENGFGPPESAVPVYLRERVALTERERGVVSGLRVP